MRAVVRRCAPVARRCWLSTEAAAAQAAEPVAEAKQDEQKKLEDLVPPIAKIPVPRKFREWTVEHYNRRAYQAAVDARRLLYRTEWLEQQRLKAIAFTLKRDQQLKESAIAQAERDLRKEAKRKALEREMERTKEERERVQAILKRNSLKKQALHKLEQDTKKLHQLRYLEAEMRDRWVAEDGSNLTYENVFAPNKMARLVGWWPRPVEPGSTGVGAAAVVNDPLDVVPTIEHGDAAKLGRV